jgi:hypothetical protein
MIFFSKRGVPASASIDAYDFITEHDNESARILLETTAAKLAWVHRTREAAITV